MDALDKYGSYEIQKAEAEVNSKLAVQQEQTNALIAQQNAVLAAQANKTSGWQAVASNPFVIVGALIIVAFVARKALK